MTWKASAERSVYSTGGVVFRIGRLSDETSTMSEVVKFQMEDRQLGVMPESTDLGLLHGADAISFMQAVMDAGYEFGLRPSAAQDERHMKAHLDDMRKISFRLLDMEGWKA